MRKLSPSEAAGIIRPVDSLSVPLGPGVPGEFLHALDSREDFQDFQVNGALLPDLFGVFTKPGVSYRSGFFGPAERFLLSAGVDVQFVPSDFRGFISMLEQVNSRRRRVDGIATGRRRLDEPLAARRRPRRRTATGRRRPRSDLSARDERALPAHARHRTPVSPCAPRRRGRCRRRGRLHAHQPGRCTHHRGRGGDRRIRRAVHPRRGHPADRDRRHPQHDRDGPRRGLRARATASTPRCSPVA